MLTCDQPFPNIIIYKRVHFGMILAKNHEAGRQVDFYRGFWGHLIRRILLTALQCFLP